MTAEEIRQKAKDSDRYMCIGSMRNGKRFNICLEMIDYMDAHPQEHGYCLISNDAYKKVIDMQVAKTLDELLERLLAKRYYTETEEGWSGYTVEESDIRDIIEQMKGEQT